MGDAYNRNWRMDPDWARSVRDPETGGWVTPEELAARKSAKEANFQEERWRAEHPVSAGIADVVAWPFRRAGEAISTVASGMGVGFRRMGSDLRRVGELPQRANEYLGETLSQGNRTWGGGTPATSLGPNPPTGFQRAPGAGGPPILSLTQGYQPWRSEAAATGVGAPATAPAAGTAWKYTPETVTPTARGTIRGAGGEDLGGAGYVGAPMTAYRSRAGNLFSSERAALEHDVNQGARDLMTNHGLDKGLARSIMASADGDKGLAAEYVQRNFGPGMGSPGQIGPTGRVTRESVPMAQIRAEKTGPALATRATAVQERGMTVEEKKAQVEDAVAKGGMSLAQGQQELDKFKAETEAATQKSIAEMNTKVQGRFADAANLTAQGALKQAEGVRRQAEIAAYQAVNGLFTEPGKVDFAFKSELAQMLGATDKNGRFIMGYPEVAEYLGLYKMYLQGVLPKEKETRYSQLSKQYLDAKNAIARGVAVAKKVPPDDLFAEVLNPTETGQ